MGGRRWEKEERGTRRSSIGALFCVKGLVNEIAATVFRKWIVKSYTGEKKLVAGALEREISIRNRFFRGCCPDRTYISALAASLCEVRISARS